MSKYVIRNNPIEFMNTSSLTIQLENKDGYSIEDIRFWLKITNDKLKDEKK